MDKASLLLRESLPRRLVTVTLAAARRVRKKCCAAQQEGENALLYHMVRFSTTYGSADQRRVLRANLRSFLLRGVMPRCSTSEMPK